MHKILSDPAAPDRSVIAGLTELAGKLGLGLTDFLGEIGVIRHGTTIAANALITGRHARVGLLTTRGFRDTLQMRRLVREEIYNPRAPAPVPLVPRSLRLPIAERTDPQGRILESLQEADAAAAVSALREAGVESVAIALLHSYANGGHEDALRKIVHSVMPDAFVAISSRALPEIKFYERVSTTVFNAAVGPILAGYLGRLSSVLEASGFGGRLLVVQGNGGMTVPSLAVEKAALTINSGPAGGVQTARHLAAQQGFNAAVSVDMGGTSCDVALVWEGEPLTTTEYQIGGFSVAYPMLDIHSIGAGGGSYVWIDPGGFLRVGPDSAGANPGPACYGLGGTQPTVTDVNLVLGYLDPSRFAAGSMRLHRERAIKSLRDNVAMPLKLDVEDAAWGAYQVVNAGMASAIREITINRGYDPRDALLVVGGGAGGCHAAALAVELGVSQVLLPRQAAGFSAMGLLLSDIRHDFVRTYKVPVLDVDKGRLENLISEMQAEAEGALDEALVPHETRAFRWWLEMRYVGQLHQIDVEVTRESLTNGLTSTPDLFHKRHLELFGYEAREDPVEMVNIRLVALGRSSDSGMKSSWKSSPARGAIGPRLARFGDESIEFQLVEGESLAVGARVAGPSIIFEPYTTIVIPPGWAADIDGRDNFLLTRGDIVNEEAP